MRSRFAVAPFTLALLAAASAVPAAAATCKPESVAGLWVGHATVEVDLYCLIDVKKSGVVAQSSCFNPKTLKPEATLDGKVTLETNIGSAASCTDDICKQIGQYVPIAKSFITPDVDGDSDGILDSMSVGVRIKATSATMSGVMCEAEPQ